MSAVAIAIQNNIGDERLSTAPSSAAQGPKRAYRRPCKGGINFRTPVVKVSRLAAVFGGLVASRDSIARRYNRLARSSPTGSL
jgi:hypothetical protein